MIVTCAPESPMSTLVQEPSADVLHLHGEPPASPPDPTRGLKLARRLERSADLLRQARLRVHATSARGRKRTLARIDRLFTVVQALERDVIGLEPSKPFSQDLRALLDECDEQLSFAISRKKSLRKRHLKLLRLHVRHVRRRLEALLS
jgi:hypothetical protein